MENVAKPFFTTFLLGGEVTRKFQEIFIKNQLKGPVFQKDILFLSFKSNFKHLLWILPFISK